MSSKGKSQKPDEGFSALAPSRRFPEFRSTGDWKPQRLSRFLSESRLIGSKGDVAKKITVKLWGGGVFAKSDEIQGSFNTQYFKRKAGQFIYSKLDFLNQAFGIIPDDLDGYESTVDLPCFDMNSEICSKFLLEYVKRKDFYLKVGEAADGSRIAKRIHPETFLASEVLLPSLSEQQKIADCLDSADALIAAQGRKVEALRAHKKGLMQQLFPQEGETQPRRRFPEFKGTGDWKENSLGRVAKLFKGKGISKADIQSDGDRPCIRYGELYTRYGEVIDSVYSKTSAERSALFLSKINDVIIPASGETKIDIAKASCVMRDDVALGGDLNVIRTAQNGIFLSYSLNGPKRLEIAKIAQGDTVVHLYPSQLEKLRVRLPSISEQHRIADCLTSLDDLIAAETRKLDMLKVHKKGLMQQLFPSVGGDDA